MSTAVAVPGDDAASLGGQRQARPGHILSTVGGDTALHTIVILFISRQIIETDYIEKE
jgi:hypothetical protein